MAGWDLRSKREERKAKQGQDDVLQYDSLPSALRVQITHILTDTIGKWQIVRSNGFANVNYVTNSIWEIIFKTFIREKGVYALSDTERENPVAQCMSYLLKAGAVDALDLIEVVFRIIKMMGPHHLTPAVCRQFGLSMTADEAVEELNRRFQEHGVGYEFTNQELVRVDSKLLHAEAVKPALRLLNSSGKGFSGPEAEFLAAHAKYRNGDYKEAILFASHAFESTLKAICSERGWSFNAQKDTASDLLRIVYANNLIPPHLQNQFNGLRTVLESGSPTIRNKTPGAGHGQGAMPLDAPQHVARYALNLAASNIVFLIESHLAKP